MFNRLSYQSVGLQTERNVELLGRAGVGRGGARTRIGRRGAVGRATGGGAFVNDETRALILDKAIAIWLDSDIDTLVERTSRKDNRPLLKQGNPREVYGRFGTLTFEQANERHLEHNGVNLFTFTI